MSHCDDGGVLQGLCRPNGGLYQPIRLIIHFKLCVAVIGRSQRGVRVDQKDMLVADQEIVWQGVTR